MKIEIDLNDILGDEFGAETLQDSVRRQVIAKMTDEINKGIGKKIDEEIALTIKKSLDEVAKNILPNLMENLIDTEYTPVDQWGDRSKGQTSFRKELIKSIHENMVYKKDSYSDRENSFTRCVDAVIKNEVQKFEKNFTEIVTTEVSKKTIDFAVAELKKRLKL